MSTNIPAVQNNAGIRMAEFVRITEDVQGDYVFTNNPAPAAYVGAVSYWTDGTNHYRVRAFFNRTYLSTGTQSAGGAITWSAEVQLASGFSSAGPSSDGAFGGILPRPSVINGQTVIPGTVGTNPGFLYGATPATATTTRVITNTLTSSWPARAVAGTASRVVAVVQSDSSGGGQVWTATSLTGTYTQSSATFNADFNPSNVIYANNLFILTGWVTPANFTGTYYFYTSTDGVNWTERTITNTRRRDTSGYNTRYITNADYVNNRWIVFGSSGSVVYSTNGTTWTTSNILVGQTVASVTYLNSRYVFLLNDISSGTSIFTTADLVSYSQIFQNSSIPRAYAGVVGSYWSAYGAGQNATLVTTDFVITVIPSNIYTFSNSYKDETINGQLFSALGGYLGIAAQQRSIRATSYDLSMSISGLDPANIYRVLVGNLRGSTLEMWRGFYDSNYNLSSVVKRYTGTVTSYSIDEVNEGQQVLYTVIVNSSNYKVILENNVSGRKTNNISWRDPKFNNTTDSSMDNVQALVGAYFDFGKKV